MPRKSFLRYRVPLGFAFAAWYLMVARPRSLFAVVLCGVWVAAGCLLRAWAAGCLLKGKRVAVGGPYAYIRNPLYVGSFVIGVGFCAALWRVPLSWPVLVLWVSFLLGFGGVYRSKVLAEERELEANLGEAYRLYARQVPAFLPWRGRVSGLGPQRFSWELYRRNREVRCLLGSAAVLGVLYGRYWHGF
jgi:protein-S-isoprenylcysteine O-methyltransferase Ste14